MRLFKFFIQALKGLLQISTFFNLKLRQNELAIKSNPSVYEEYSFVDHDLFMVMIFYHYGTSHAKKYTR